jgi:hypothetical protein
MKLPENISGMSRQEFDAYVLTQCNAYSLTQYLGSGQYRTEYFVDFQDPDRGLTEARAAKKDAEIASPQGRFMIYGLVVVPAKTDKGYRIAMQVFVE